MNNNVFDTQKVRLDLAQQLLETKEQLAEASGDAEKLIDLGYQIQWLQRKISFIGSGEYQERKRRLGLDASNDSLSRSLNDAGFGSAGPM